MHDAHHWNHVVGMNVQRGFARRVLEQPHLEVGVSHSSFDGAVRMLKALDRSASIEGSRAMRCCMRSRTTSYFQRRIRRSVDGVHLSLMTRPAQKL